MVKITIDISESTDYKVKFISLERRISSKALMISKLLEEYLEKFDIKNGSEYLDEARNNNDTKDEITKVTV